MHFRVLEESWNHSHMDTEGRLYLTFGELKSYTRWTKLPHCLTINSVFKIMSRKHISFLVRLFEVVKFDFKWCLATCKMLISVIWNEVIFWNTLAYIYFDLWNPQHFCSNRLLSLHSLNTLWVYSVVEKEGTWSLASKSLPTERRLSLKWQVITTLCFRL